MNQNDVIKRLENKKITRKTDDFIIDDNENQNINKKILFLKEIENEIEKEDLEKMFSKYPGNKTIRFIKAK